MTVSDLLKQSCNMVQSDNINKLVAGYRSLATNHATQLFDGLFVDLSSRFATSCEIFTCVGYSVHSSAEEELEDREAPPWLAPSKNVFNSRKANCSKNQVIFVYMNYIIKGYFPHCRLISSVNKDVYFF